MLFADKLDPDKIRPKTKRIGAKIVVFDSTSSTNDIAARYGSDASNDGLVIFAEMQTAGRGRGTNQWVSPKGMSVLCSVVLAETTVDSELLSLTCAVAVAEAVGHQAKIKWPNDIIFNGRKVAGILLESKQQNGRTAFIMGVGVNCHQTGEDFPDELRDVATSLDIEAGSVCDRNVVAKRLLSSIEHWLGFAEKKSKKVLKRWRKLSTLLNQRVALVYDEKQFAGTCIGIDPQKGLILQLDTGAVRFFDAGHTSILK